MVKNIGPLQYCHKTQFAAIASLFCFEKQEKLDPNPVQVALVGSAGTGGRGGRKGASIKYVHVRTEAEGRRVKIWLIMRTTVLIVGCVKNVQREAKVGAPGSVNMR